MSLFDKAFSNKKTKVRFGSSANYKKFKVDDDDDEPRKLSPREGCKRKSGEWSVQTSDTLRSWMAAPRSPVTDMSCVAVVDQFIGKDQVAELRELAEFGMAHGGGAGGATILDFPSGALSFGEKFIDVHQVLASKDLELPMAHTRSFLDVTSRIKKLIMQKYGLDILYPTTPRFFSRMDGSKPPKTQHDEYWHPHIDAQQYPGFEYTALVYLNEQGRDFQGGEFSFVDTNKDREADDDDLCVSPLIYMLQRDPTLTLNKLVSGRYREVDNDHAFRWKDRLLHFGI